MGTSLTTGFEPRLMMTSSRTASLLNQLRESDFGLLIVTIVIADDHCTQEQSLESVTQGVSNVDYRAGGSTKTWPQINSD